MAAEKYVNICESQDCTGCMACVNVCSHGSIEVVESDLGFKYPRIKLDSCVNCGLCKKVCPAINLRPLSFPKKCYAVRLKDSAMLNNCASGGAASAFALSILRAGGIVVGCSGEEMREVKHVVVETENDIYRLQGSKYVQSSIAKDLYKRIKSYLVIGKKVLFIGTACQTAGLQNYLFKPYENLFTVDLICHGVPSQKMLNENIDKYKGMDSNSLKFRLRLPKSDGSAIRFGWSATTHIGKESKEVFVPAHKDAYMAAFLDLLTFRDCCYRCKYAYSARQSDITIGDFWGLGSGGASIMRAEAGASSALIVTEKGETLFNMAKDILTTEERGIQEAVSGNRQLQLPSKQNPLRKKFELLYKERGFIDAVKRTTIRNNKLRRILLIPGKIMKKVALVLDVKM